MVSYSLYHRGGSGVAHTEPLACNAAYKGFSAGGSVEGHISDDDILLRLKGNSRRRIDNQLAAGKTFSKVVVGIAYQLQGQALGNKRAEALTAAAAAANGVGVLRQSLRVFPGNLRAEDGSQGTVYIGNIHLDAPLLAASQSGLHFL